MTTVSSLILMDDGEFYIEQCAVSINPHVKGFLLRRDPALSTGAGVGYECLGWFGLQGCKWTAFIDIPYDEVRDTDVECLGCFPERAAAIECLWNKRHDARSTCSELAKG